MLQQLYVANGPRFEGHTETRTLRAEFRNAPNNEMTVIIKIIVILFSHWAEYTKEINRNSHMVDSLWFAVDFYRAFIHADTPRTSAERLPLR